MFLKDHGDVPYPPCLVHSCGKGADEPLQYVLCRGARAAKSSRGFGPRCLCPGPWPGARAGLVCVLGLRSPPAFAGRGVWCVQLLKPCRLYFGEFLLGFLHLRGARDVLVSVMGHVWWV